MAYLLPLKGDSSSVNVEPKRILIKANMRAGATLPFNNKAKITVAIPAIIIRIIIGIIICSGIAGAGRDP